VGFVIYDEVIVHVSPNCLITLLLCEYSGKMYLGLESKGFLYVGILVMMNMTLKWEMVCGFHWISHNYAPILVINSSCALIIDETRK